MSELRGSADAGTRVHVEPRSCLGPIAVDFGASLRSIDDQSGGVVRDTWGE